MTQTSVTLIGVPVDTCASIPAWIFKTFVAVDAAFAIRGDAPSPRAAVSSDKTRLVLGYSNSIWLDFF